MRQPIVRVPPLVPIAGTVPSTDPAIPKPLAAVGRFRNKAES